MSKAKIKILSFPLNSSSTFLLMQSIEFIATTIVSQLTKVPYQVQEMNLVYLT